MADTSTAIRRDAAVRDAMNDVRRIDSCGPLDRDRVAAMRSRLLDLVADRDLFPEADFPPPVLGSVDPLPRAYLYRIAEDDDGRFALYVNACRDQTDSPPHNHTTWAVVVGFTGEELNRFYRRTATTGGVEVTHEEVVQNGTGVAMLPDDVHSIHIRGGGMNFHMYGLALDRLKEREYYSERENAWKNMAAMTEIREARPLSVPSAG